jgi:hypothetical protein
MSGDAVAVVGMSRRRRQGRSKWFGERPSAVSVVRSDIQDIRAEADEWRSDSTGSQAVGYLGTLVHKTKWKQQRLC